jgi:hypothetical protein
MRYEPALRILVIEKDGRQHFSWKDEANDRIFLAKKLHAIEACGGEFLRAWRGRELIGSGIMMHVGSRESDEPTIMSTSPGFGRIPKHGVGLDGRSFTASVFQPGDELFLFPRMGKIPTESFPRAFWSMMVDPRTAFNEELYEEGLVKRDQDEVELRPA